MHKIALAVGLVLVIALAVLKLAQLLQWRRCEAIVPGDPALPSPLFGSTGQKIPIVFHLQDGSIVETTLRSYGKSGIPRAGTRLQILHDPNDPAQLEWAIVIPIVAVILAILLAVLVETVIGLF